MSRYIDADKLCKNLTEMAKYQEPYKQSTILGVVSTIENTRAADVVEVTHGYWKTVTELKDNTVCGNRVNIQYKICSNCKYPIGVTDNIYCGHCGAKNGRRKKSKRWKVNLFIKYR